MHNSSVAKIFVTDMHFTLKQKFNISRSDLDDFFSGPAFLAWSRMANLHG